MNAHRIFCLPEPQARQHTWRGILAAIAAVATLGTLVIVASRGDPMGPRPVQTFEAVPTALAPMDGQALAEIRVESFRAGYETAIQDGCRPALAPPITRTAR
jgi:hypothetical protein